MPLDFLKRKGNADAATAAPAKTTSPSNLMPEEVVAQDHQLKLYYAGKSSEGVRLKAGPAAIAELPTMLVGLARSEIEVVEPLPIEFSQATPTIVSPSEAMQWLNAHHVHSPITRHALVVLESIDAVDLRSIPSSVRSLTARWTRPVIRNTTRSSGAWPRTGTRRRAT